AVRPTLISGGQENQCLNNAMGLMEAEGHQVVSGWLSIRKPSGERAQFTQHWWNFDEARGLYVDCSPSIEENAIHILDLEIAMYAALGWFYLTVLPTWLGGSATALDVSVGQIAWSVGVFLGIPLALGALARASGVRARGRAGRRVRRRRRSGRARAGPEPRGRVTARPRPRGPRPRRA
ncbi:MAG: hypothetical protein ACO3RG_05160, partial [Nitriliruptoraceae bacterium]